MTNYSENRATGPITLEETVTEAILVQGDLRDYTKKFEEAIQAKQLAHQRNKEGQQSYGDAESEFTLDVMYSEEYAKGKNAELRKAILDVALIKGRQSGGPLYAAWQAKLRAEQVLFDAEIAYAQAEARFKGIRSAAYLQANTLQAVAVA